MKALIRNTGETVRETDNIEGIDWTTGAPLTNPAWCGGAYTLSPYYPEDAIPEDFNIEEHEVSGVIRKIAVLDHARYEARIAEESNDLPSE